MDNIFNRLSTVHCTVAFLWHVVTNNENKEQGILANTSCLVISFRSGFLGCQFAKWFIIIFEGLIETEKKMIKEYQKSFHVWAQSIYKTWVMLGLIRLLIITAVVQSFYHTPIACELSTVNGNFRYWPRVHEDKAIYPVQWGLYRRALLLFPYN